MREPSGIALTAIPTNLLDQILSATETYIRDEDPTQLQHLRKEGDERICFLLDVILQMPENPRPIYSVLRIVRKRYSCFGIVEYPYFDLDVWASYSKVYSASFTPYYRICHRIHFFAGPDEKASAIIKGLRYGCTLKHIEVTDLTPVYVPHTIRGLSTVSIVYS